MIIPIKRPPEAKGTVENQLEDIRNYLNIIYRRLMMNTDECYDVIKELYQSVSGSESSEIKNLFSKTIQAEKVVVESDLVDGKTIIDGGTIQTGTIDAARINTDELIAKRMKVGNVTTGNEGYNIGGSGTNVRAKLEYESDNPTANVEFQLLAPMDISNYELTLKKNDGIVTAVIRRFGVDDCLVEDVSQSTERTLYEWLNEINDRLDALEG